MSKLVCLSLADEISPRLAHYYAQLEDVRRHTKRYVRDLSPTQLSWTPAPDVESIGTLLWHIAGVERSWIGEDINRVAMTEEWAPAFPLRTGLVQVQDKPLEFFFEKLDAVRAETHQTLLGLTDADLGRDVSSLEDEAKEDPDRFTIDWILYHLIEHEAHHRGQIALLRRLSR